MEAQFLHEGELTMAWWFRLRSREAQAEARLVALSGASMQCPDERDHFFINALNTGSATSSPNTSHTSRASGTLPYRLSADILPIN